METDLIALLKNHWDEIVKRVSHDLSASPRGVLKEVNVEDVNSRVTHLFSSLVQAFENRNHLLFIAYVEGLARKLSKDRYGIDELQRTFASLEKVLGKIFQTYAPERDVLGYFGAINAILGEARSRVAHIGVEARRES